MLGFGSDDKEEGWNSWNAPLKGPAAFIGLISAALVIMSDYSDNPTLSLAGKGLFWSAMVLVGIFGLNRDLARIPAAWILAACLTALQVKLLVIFWHRLSQFDFVELAMVAMCQMIVFFLPFLLLRKIVGVEYHPRSDD